METVLQQAAELLKARRLDEGIALCRQLLRRQQGNAAAHHLIALAERDRGDAAAAEVAFRASLAGAPDHPGVLVDFGNLLRRIGKHAEAEKRFRRALELAPRFPPAWHGLGLLLQATGRSGEAEACARRLLELSPDSAAAWELLAAALQAQQRLDEAISACEEGLRHLPSALRLRYSLAQLQREDCRFDEAIASYGKALEDGFSPIELFQNCADACIESGQIDRALQTYEEGIRRYPRSAMLHSLRARCLWESGSTEDPVDALWAAARGAVGDAALWEKLAELLHSLGRRKDVLRALAEARNSACERSPGLGQLEAVMLARAGETAEATAAFERLVKVYPGHEGLRLAFAEHALGSSDPSRCAALCQEVLAGNPLSQYALALLGTAWGLMGDPREHWLLDYDTMVISSSIVVPPAYPDMSSFLEAAAGVLNGLHRMHSHPVEQTLRGGTQTNGFLFRLKSPVLRDLQASILATLANVASGFDCVAKHPFWGRFTQGYALRLAGAWSVRLRDAGFHTNHIHPQGWLSSALYIALPAEITGEGAAGCLQFGVPPVETGLHLPPRRIVTPQEGVLTLFPSYMWHGTVPFQSAEPRLTVSVDAVPEPHA
jgi:tetratricopeptide (TPR) repeat protein